MTTSTALLFTTTALLAFQSNPLAYVSHIPTPNICEPIKDTLFQHGSWRSHDCPVNALCIPTSNSSAPGRCECGYTEDMLTKTEAGKCIPSPSTKVYASFWVILCAVDCVALAMLVDKIFKARKANVLRRDTLFASVLAVGSATTMFLFNRLTRVVQLLHTNASDTALVSVSTLVDVSLVLLGFLSLFSLFLCGISLYVFVLTTARSQRVNTFTLRLWLAGSILCVTVVVIPASFVAVLVGQYVIVIILTAFCTCFVWFVFVRVAMRGAGLVTNWWSIRFSTTSQLHAQHSMGGAVEQMLTLSRRILIPLTGYFVSAAAYTSLWYLGRHHPNRMLLGAGKAVTVSTNYFFILLGILTLERFFDRMYTLRTTGQSVVHVHVSPISV